jgi:hypothetical protein
VKRVEKIIDYLAIEIKLCPYCGGRPDLISRGKTYKAPFTFGCSDNICWNYIPDDVEPNQLHNYAPCYVTIESLLEDWNRREVKNESTVEE